VTCCAPGVEAAIDLNGPSDDELRLSSRTLGNGVSQVELSVPGVHCAACIRTVEHRLKDLPGIVGARVNLSTRRVAVQWRGDNLPPIVSTLKSAGYVPHLFDAAQETSDQTLSELILAVAVSGFAATNIMLLSVSVWSGAEGATRQLFHWVSALIAIPALFFAGRIYYRSAWNALRHRHMNMDVPIAVGITLAYAMSLYETAMNGEHAYFDASVSLLFFLLIGRTLDHVMRERARSAVAGLARLQPRGALVVTAHGEREYRSVSDIRPGDRILIAAGERIPVDAIIETGTSDIDASITSGESAPAPVAPLSELRAGMLNLTGPLTAVATRTVSESFLGEMTRLMEAAEGGRKGFRRVAERVSALYAPVVHLGALLTFIGWMIASGDWHKAMIVAIAVLIITCPCALGLAVPIVHVVAARRLFEAGILLKDGSALERLADVDTLALDKTGTLTLGRLRLVNLEQIADRPMSIASALAVHSRHPAAIAIASAGRSANTRFDEISERPGLGLEARMGNDTWRLGRSAWAVEAGPAIQDGTVLSKNGVEIARFEFDDVLRPGAAEMIASARRAGMAVEMLSGDTESACRLVAARVAIDHFAWGLYPSEKVERLATLAGQGRKTLMVGDGLNDAPALAAAHVSMAPVSAAEVGRNAADVVFLGENLNAVTETLKVARRADALVRQNITIAVVYNVIAVPVAVFGHATPLIAAIAMSASSLVVVANALRLVTGKSFAPLSARGRSEALA
jgi:Cu2+-exporting ATPase